ncbi:MAG: glycosyltransferase [Gammaproteobacteria bacterium]|nr:glycosyltransferase [Gammaproteobacteria bacterium]
MTATATVPRVMIWVQHLLGIGHRRRAAAIARALAERGADVAFVTGGVGAPEVDPVRVRVVALPAVRAEDASYRVLVDGHGRKVADAWRAARRDMLLAVFEEHAPHVLVTETYPFGRRLLRFELEPLVERARSAGCRLVSSIRDVLQPPSKPSRARDVADSVLACYDAVLVHGDPAFVRLEASFPEAGRIGECIRYTGYVAAGRGPAAPPGVGEGEVVVSAGGGVVAHRLVDTALESARLDDRARWRILVGPNAGAQAFAGWRRRASANAFVEPNRADFRSILSRARVSISQAGYNTVTDLLATGVRAVLVPFSAEGEREQSIRARLLADAGVARVIDEDRLSPGTLLDSVGQSDATAGSSGRMVRLDGAAESAEAVLEIARGVIGSPRR